MTESPGVKAHWVCSDGLVGRDGWPEAEGYHNLQCVLPARLETWYSDLFFYAMQPSRPSVRQPCVMRSRDIFSTASPGQPITCRISLCLSRWVSSLTRKSLRYLLPFSPSLLAASRLLPCVQARVVWPGDFGFDSDSCGCGCECE